LYGADQQFIIINLITVEQHQPEHTQLELEHDGIPQQFHRCYGSAEQLVERHDVQPDGQFQLQRSDRFGVRKREFTEQQRFGFRTEQCLAQLQFQLDRSERRGGRQLQQLA